MDGVSPLPAEATALLQKAAGTAHSPSDPLARQKAIERAIAEVKARWPHCFREEPIDG